MRLSIFKAKKTKNITMNIFKWGERLVFNDFNRSLCSKSETSKTMPSATNTPEKIIPKSIPPEIIAETTAVTTVVIAVSN